MRARENRTQKEEYELGTNPLSNHTDEVGLLDFEEVSTYKTNPADADIDKDGLNDAINPQPLKYLANNFKIVNNL